MSHRLPALLLVGVLFAGAALSGCLDDAPEEGDGTTDAATQQTQADAAANATVDDGTTPMSEDLGHQPHLHDYWTGRERVTLMDQEVKVDPFSGMFFTFFNVVGTRTPGVGGTFLELPDGAIVYEGTGKLEFTASWSDPLVTGMTLRYRSAASPDFSEPLALAKGEPLVIEVLPEMSDMPHEKTSRWQFLLMAGSGQAMAGTFHVKVDIVKMGDIALFPGHPELFHGADTLTLYEGPAKSSQSSFAGRIVDVAVNGWGPEDDIVRPTAVVPMETRSMTANVTITSATANVGKVSGVTFLYKPASTNGWVRAPVVSSDPDKGVYQFAWLVEMSETDSPYAKTSQWGFDVRVQTDLTGMGGQCGGCSDAEVEYNLVAVAYDDVVEGAEKSDDDRDG